MLSRRSLLMTTTGLLLGYLAAAQTTDAPSPAATAANADMLSWMLGGVLCAAGLVFVLAMIAVVTATVTRRSEAAEPLPVAVASPVTPAASPASVGQPAATAPELVQEGVATW
ncbi:MAG: hypothetical protein ACRYG7_46985 [Janthinobacterium lividum]